MLFRCPIHGHVCLSDGSVQAEVAKKHPDWLVQRDGKLYLQEPAQPPEAAPVPGNPPPGGPQPMNGRVWFSGFLVVVCLATLWGVWGQRSELAGLRAEHQQLQAQLAARADSPASPPRLNLQAPAQRVHSRLWW